MGKRFRFGARIAVALRWLLRRLRVKPFGCVVLSEYEGVATPIRSSNDPIAISWSVWIVIGEWYRGWGSVRTWARNEDLEIWVAGYGPFGSESGRVELWPRVKAPAEDFRSLRVRNAAPNKRDISAHVQLVGRVCSDGGIAKFGPITNYYFYGLPAGETAQILMDGSGNMWWPCELEASALVYKTLPVGEERIERLYGRPEWMDGK
jgi:hypothetical protein